VVGIPIISVAHEHLVTAGGNQANLHDPEYARNEPGHLGDQPSNPSRQDAQIR
jgi:hypothetical protein